MPALDQRAGRSVVSDLLETTRRYLVILAIGFWLGGFTFYAGVVIHTGHHVFGRRETGFLTQQVTGWINLSGDVALAVLFWNAVALRRVPGRWAKTGLWGTWMLMAAVQVTLYLLHPVLDRMLDIETQRIVERARFYETHKIYMNLSTMQWVAGLVHTWLALVSWQRLDCGKATRPHVLLRPQSEGE